MAQKYSRDIAIRVSGLLQSIIVSGAEPEEWRPLLHMALKLHDVTCTTIGGNGNGTAAEVNEKQNRNLC